MSINTLMDYKKLKKNRVTARTVIAPCNPRDIRYCENRKMYVVNYVLKTGGVVKGYRISFKSYSDAYTQMNTARTQQGFQALPPFKKYQGE